MKSANFTVMKRFDKEIVLGCDSWQQLIQKYTPYLYYHNSKHIRQESDFKNNIYSLLTDEIIVKSNEKTFLDDFHELMKILVPYLEIVQIEAFKLICLHSKKKIFCERSVSQNSRNG